MRIVFSAASLRDPAESVDVLVGYEEALYCDGSECGSSTVSEDGEPELLQPHWHISERRKSPDAGPRYYAVWGGPSD